MQHRDDAVALVDRVDDPVAISLAPIKQLAKIAAFGNGRASGREFVEAQNRLLNPVEPCAGLRGILGVDSQEDASEVPGRPLRQVNAVCLDRRGFRRTPRRPAALGRS